MLFRKFIRQFYHPRFPSNQASKLTLENDFFLKSFLKAYASTSSQMQYPGERKILPSERFERRIDERRLSALFDLQREMPEMLEERRRQRD